MRRGEPDFFTVEEAADRLRIGRTSAHLAAKQYRVTGGTDGLPVIANPGACEYHAANSRSGPAAR